MGDRAVTCFQCEESPIVDGNLEECRLDDGNVVPLCECCLIEIKQQDTLATNGLPFGQGGPGARMHIEFMERRAPDLKTTLDGGLTRGYPVTA